MNDDTYEYQFISDGYNDFKMYLDGILDHGKYELINECKHEPINVGFHFTKIVCKKCDKEL